MNNIKLWKTLDNKDYTIYLEIVNNIWIFWWAWTGRSNLVENIAIQLADLGSNFIILGNIWDYNKLINNYPNQIKKHLIPDFSGNWIVDFFYQINDEFFKHLDQLITTRKTPELTTIIIDEYEFFEWVLKSNNIDINFYTKMWINKTLIHNIRILITWSSLKTHPVWKTKNLSMHKLESLENKKFWFKNIYDKQIFTPEYLK